MDIRVTFADEPGSVLSIAKEFLASQPVLHNMVLSLLHARVARSEAGRYWLAANGDDIVGMVFQSPLTFPATLTPMEPEVAAAMVNAIADAGSALPGVNGQAATAASFAGHWTERCKSAAVPIQGLRLYELQDLNSAIPKEGKLRQAIPADRDLVVRWTRAFHAEVHEPLSDPESIVERLLSAGHAWLWNNSDNVSMAISRERVEGVVRISGVYTPPEIRGRGYASACVHALSKMLREAGHRCILYTDLADPTSNSIYRRIGYKAVAEVLRYRFDQRSSTN